MKSIQLALLLLLIPLQTFAQEERAIPAPSEKVTPEQIERILDFESLDREIEEKEERFREYLRSLDPREAEIYNIIRVAASNLGEARHG